MSQKSAAAANEAKQREQTQPVITDEDSPGVFMPIPMYIRYGDNKELVCNPNAGFASIMDYVRDHLKVLGITEKDHIELCDDHGKLLNQQDFPNMMFMTSFIKPGAEEATFVPAKVERDEHKRVVKVDIVLRDFEHVMPEMYTRVKREYHNHLVGSDGKMKSKKANADLSHSHSASTARGQTPMPHNREREHETAKKTRHSRERSREERRKSQLAKLKQ